MVDKASEDYANAGLRAALQQARGLRVVELHTEDGPIVVNPRAIGQIFPFRGGTRIVWAGTCVWTDFTETFEEVREVLVEAGWLWVPGMPAEAPVQAAGGCDCEFDPYDDSDKESCHYRRTCAYCGEAWWGLHCPHDGYQNPCPKCGTRPEVTDA